MKLTTKNLALCAVLTALALGLSTLENLFPVSLLVPLPGVKLGLANIVTVFALYQLGPLPALCILAARCLLGSLFAGNASALLFSLLGGTLAMLVMLALSRLPGHAHKPLALAEGVLEYVGSRAVPQKGHSNAVCLLQDRLQNSLFYFIKIGEAVKKHIFIPQIV